MKYILLSALALPFIASAQTTCNAPKPSGSIKPSVASGYKLQVVATGLSRPRGLAFDSAGNLLIVQAGSGSITSHKLTDTNGCVLVADSKTIVSGLSLNHGIQMSSDGKTLYASDTDKVYSWAYAAGTRTATGQTTLIQGMTNNDHTTRTLQLAKKAPGWLVVSRGSNANLDYSAANKSSGTASVRAFNLNTRGSNIYNYNTDGKLLGWGMRNDVGVAEHPSTGGIWTVENSADNIVRYGQQVNQNNPAEELNFLGYLNGTSHPNQGGNFGYPWCFTAWAPSELPQNQNLKVGTQFALSQSADLNNQNKTDAYCLAQIAPRISFQAHMAPLDIKFDTLGTTGWVSFHGSWDRSIPIGYKVSTLAFSNGSPVAASTSNTALTDIVKNQADTDCPNNCFRPAGLLIDPKGRVLFSSDASGEIYLITKIGSTSSAPLNPPR